jgi:hypothetical protein
MSFTELLVHSLLIAHPDPATSPDETGQLFVDATGQPVGDATVDEETDLTDWTLATAVRGRVSERTARWPDGPGAGAQLVDTRIYLEPETAIRELDKIRRVDTQQAYQAVFVNAISGGPGTAGHIEVQARRIPL